MTPEQDRMYRARQLSAESAGRADPTGWFEQLYAEGEAGIAVVPWILGEPNESMVEWVTAHRAGRRALVVGCGTGDDAEYLAGLGFDVTAFDIAPTAIAAARRLHPDSSVQYQVADLLDLPPAWSGAFDLVVENYTVQPLYGEVREQALRALHGPVAPGGALLVIGFATDEADPVRNPAQMPWPLTRAELDLARGPLRVRGIEQFIGRVPALPRWRAEFGRDPGDRGPFPVPAISTARLQLREFTPDDLDLVSAAAAAGDQDGLPLGAPANTAQLAEWLDAGQYPVDRWDGVHLMMLDRDRGRMVGAIGVFHADWEVGSAEIGYAVRGGERGKGYATEALAGVARWALTEGGIQRAWLGVNSDNAASLRVAEKAGFRYEGTMRRASKEQDGLHDLAIFSLLEGELPEGEPPDAAADQLPARGSRA